MRASSFVIWMPNFQTSSSAAQNATDGIDSDASGDGETGSWMAQLPICIEHRSSWLGVIAQERQTWGVPPWLRHCGRREAVELVVAFRYTSTERSSADAKRHAETRRDSQRLAKTRRGREGGWLVDRC